MEQLTLEWAAEKYGELNGYTGIMEPLSSAFVAGAEWQKEQYNDVLQALKTIAAWPGNTPDHYLNTATGPNDARYRGEMVVSMRSLALEAIRKHEPDYVPFS